MRSCSYCAHPEEPRRSSKNKAGRHEACPEEVHKHRLEGDMSALLPNKVGNGRLQKVRNRQPFVAN